MDLLKSVLIKQKNGETNVGLMMVGETPAMDGPVEISIDKSEKTANQCWLNDGR